jgi:hypothetical protein
MPITIRQRSIVAINRLSDIGRTDLIFSHGYLYSSLFVAFVSASIGSDLLISSPASLAVGEIELSRNAVVWQRILAAGGLSARPAA